MRSATDPELASTWATMATRRARAYLLRVAEPPAPATAALVADVGAVAAADRIRSGAVCTEVARETSGRRHWDCADHDLSTAAQHGARLVVPEDGEWPCGWARLPSAGEGIADAAEPLGLWVRGNTRLDDLIGRTVSVVGARACTSLGETVAADLSYDLAHGGVTIVSGAAYGIDGAAHRGALAVGNTLAVLGCGLDVAYPAGHQALLTSIAERGAVASEYPPGTPPARHRFLARNRLIARSGMTVVVEAGVRSGARHTAVVAHRLSRPVGTVPGPVTSAMSVGCHQLLQDGTAHLITSAEDIRSLLAGEPPPD